MLSVQECFKQLYAKECTLVDQCYLMLKNLNTLAGEDSSYLLKPEVALGIINIRYITKTVSEVTTQSPALVAIMDKILRKHTTDGLYYSLYSETLQVSFTGETKHGVNYRTFDLSVDSDYIRRKAALGCALLKSLPEIAKLSLKNATVNSLVFDAPSEFATVTQQFTPLVIESPQTLTQKMPHYQCNHSIVRCDEHRPRQELTLYFVA